MNPCRGRTELIPGAGARLLLLFLFLGVLLAACGAKQDLAGHLDKGHDFLDDGQFEDAQLEGLYVLLREPENAEALHLVALSLLRQNRDSEAEAYFRTLGDLSQAYAREAASLFDAKARQDYENGEQARAARRWRSALDFHRGIDLDRYAFFMAGRTYEDRQWSLAADLYAKAISAYPDSGEVRKARFPFGVSLYRLERWDEAQDELETFLADYRRHPRRFEAILIYQEILIKEAEDASARMDYEGTILLLRKCLRYNENPPKTSEALLLMGASYEHMHDYPRAAECYRRIIDANIGAVGRYYDSALERLGRIEKARLK